MLWSFILELFRPLNRLLETFLYMLLGNYSFDFGVLDLLFIDIIVLSEVENQCATTTRLLIEMDTAIQNVNCSGGLHKCFLEALFSCISFCPLSLSMRGQIVLCLFFIRGQIVRNIKDLNIKRSHIFITLRL